MPAGTPIPVDLVTASASGLDPDISVAGAYYQIPRIAKARGMSQDAVRQIVGPTHRRAIPGHIRRANSERAQGQSRAGRHTDQHITRHATVRMVGVCTSMRRGTTCPIRGKATTISNIGYGTEIASYRRPLKNWSTSRRSAHARRSSSWSRCKSASVSRRKVCRDEYPCGESGARVTFV